MSLPPFSPRAYYRFSNTAFPNTGISTGYKHENTPPHLGLTPYGSRSSENWQIFRQKAPLSWNMGADAHVYFIRNYDYGAALQLGLTPEMRTVPQLLQRSGKLGQQWLMVRDPEGKWVLQNRLLGSGSVLGVVPGAGSSQYTSSVPAMNPSPDGSEKWSITINISAGEVGEDMLVDVEGLEIAYPVSTPTSYFNLPSSAATSLPTDYPSISATDPAFNRTGGACMAVVFLVLFTGLAVLWRRQRRAACADTYTYTTIASDVADAPGKDADEGLPMYVEKEDVNASED